MRFFFNRISLISITDRSFFHEADPVSSRTQRGNFPQPWKRQHGHRRGPVAVLVPRRGVQRTRWPGAAGRSDIGNPRNGGSAWTRPTSNLHSASRCTPALYALHSLQLDSARLHILLLSRSRHPPLQNGPERLPSIRGSVPTESRFHSGPASVTVPARRKRNGRI